MYREPCQSESAFDTDQDEKGGFPEAVGAIIGATISNVLKGGALGFGAVLAARILGVGI